MAKRERPPSSADWAAAYLSHFNHVFRRGHHFVFTGRYFQRIEDQMMLKAISKFVSLVDPSSATAHMVEQIVETIAISAAIPSIPPEPLWLDGSPAENVIAFENGVLLIDKFIEEQCREPALLPALPQR